MQMLRRVSGECVRRYRIASRVHRVRAFRPAAIRAWLSVALSCLFVCPMQSAQMPAANAVAGTHNENTSGTAAPTPRQVDVPPRVLAARRFLAQRGLRPGVSVIRPSRKRHALPANGAAAPLTQPSSPTWQELGPYAVVTPSYGLVTGRVSALALDPSDPTGNRLYAGTTGGGVWVSQNAADGNPAQVSFTPLTDKVEALSGAEDASISIGALTVQPGGTGVILVGTGDPNDALDSYYGAGILRSADSGNSWTLIQNTADSKWSFVGEGFAGFAWSSSNPQLVVAAVSQAYEGVLVNADIPAHSYEGLYYSADAGVTWSLATIEDSSSEVIQGPNNAFDIPDGNAATSVVWNAVRGLFIAAVRFHGYYQSTDGITWTRMTAQPGVSLTAALCPTNQNQTGSIACPIFRGTLAVNPWTGDTFAWTVDPYNQDQGLWQDQCAISLSGVCTTQNITFPQQWNTQPLESASLYGAATIANGDYNLALAAVPYAPQQGADTWLLAGANDLWKCSLAAGCVWRNTTNATTCMSAQVAEFQHALAWNTGNPLEILVGNDGGLWRSLDVIGETGPVCSASDATHFQNLNGGLGSLAEVESMAGATSSPYTLVTGLGVNGTAGVKGSTPPAADWPQILGGFGGPVAIDPGNSADWFVNNQNGVSIYGCSDASGCTPADFGTAPAIDDADVGGDGDTMASPAPFLFDALDTTQLLIGTCRVWRGPASGAGWSSANAVSPILDSGATDTACSGDALIRSMAAAPTGSSSEVIYVGTYGVLNGGAGLPGHVLSATFNSQSSSMPVWQDLTLNSVTNSQDQLNAFEYDISSIYADPHDTTGNTVYVTVEGIPSTLGTAQRLYGSTDGGAHWANLTDNLPAAPVSSVVVDPQSAGTVYVATDQGVYFTTQIATCATPGATCWSAFGTGLPGAPVVGLTASLAAESAQVLTAATYGRGVWQTPLWSAGGSLTTAAANPDALTFPAQTYGTSSSPQTVTLTNTGSLPLAVAAIAMSGDFAETDNCQSGTVAASASCTVDVTFTPSATGSRTGQMTVSANVYGGQLTVALSGTGTGAGLVSLSPSTVSFGSMEVGATSSPLQITAANGSNAPVPITALSITGPFAVSANACGTSALAADSDCQISVTFTPVVSGQAAGALTLTDGAGTQNVILNGTGAAPPTDLLNPLSVSFPATAVGQVSAVQTVLLTNTGDLTLTSISAALSGSFQIASNTCGTQLPGHSACNFNLVFAPAQLGSAGGTLTVTDALRVQTVALSGTGVKSAALSASPTSLIFAAQAVGVAGVPQTLTVSNAGGVPAANIGFQLTGAAASSFSTGTTTCAASLAGGAGCTVQVIFTPALAGSNVASLVVSSSTAGVMPVTVPLNGPGQNSAGLNVSPAQLSFPATVVGSSSAAQTVTVSNTSSAAATQLAFKATTGFALTQNTCGTSLAASSTCTVGVVFSPTATGAATGTLTVASAAIATPAIVTLTGTGSVASAIQVSPATIAFATTGAGQTSAATTVTVTNTGAVAALSNLTLAVPAGFALVNNTCAATLGPGVSCTAGVEFAPAAAGAQTGNLTVTSSSVTTAVTVPLSGMGFDFTVTVSGSGTQSVASGTSASYTLVLTPLNGSSGTFTFACDALPTNAACGFNPTTETLNSGATGNATVNVSTGSSIASLRFKTPGVWGVLPLVCGLLLLPLGLLKRRKALLIAFLLVFLAGGVTSCTGSGGGSGGGGGGGSGGGSGGSGLTSAGTYSVPVTVTSTGVSHSATLTLVVD